MKYWGIQKNPIIKKVCRIDMLEQSSIFYRCMVECNIRIRGYQKSVFLPSVQSGPFHPAEQLFGQDPSTWLHTSLLEHRPHIFSHPSPKYPLSHSECIVMLKIYINIIDHIDKLRYQILFQIRIIYIKIKVYVI